jgi:UDP:flavonoid glycosyltransferase YjiC (YdhE family)
MKKKILLQYFRSLAHMVRLIEIGRILIARGYEVYLAYPQVTSDSFSILVPDGMNIVKLKYHKYDNPALKNRFLKTMDARITEDLALLDDLQPDAIVSDDNPSSRIVSEIRNLPHIALINFYMQSRRDWTFRYPASSFCGKILRYTGGMPDLIFFGIFLEKYVNPWIENYVFDKCKNKSHFQKFDLWHGKDLTLICDEPLIFPHTDENSRMIGPIYYTGKDTPLLDRQNGKTVYLTIGISGVPESLIYLSKTLADRGYYVVVSTGFSVKKEIFSKSNRIFVGDWLNSEDVLGKVDAMIHQGSSLSFYQAILHQVPTIVIPKHPGHEIIARYVSSSRIGETLEYYGLKERTIINTLDKIFADDSYKIALSNESKKITLAYGAERAADYIAELV